MTNATTPHLKVLIPHMSCLIYQQLTESEPDPLAAAIELGYAEIYIMTPVGIVKHHKLRGTNRYVRVKVDTIPGVVLNPIKEEVSFLPAGKIPYELLHQVESFFKRVIQVKGTAVEAMIWILWNEAQGYHLFVPNQTVSKASARYDWAGVPAGSSIIVDIHSHADFSAFFSGTDNSDDSQSIRFSGVIGHNDKPIRSYAWRFNYKDKKFEIKVDDVFAIPETQPVATPEEWLSKVNTSAPAQSPATGKWHSGFSSADRAGSSDNWYKGVNRKSMGQAYPKDDVPFETYMEEYERKRAQIPTEKTASTKKSKGGSVSKKANGSFKELESEGPDHLHEQATRHDFWESSDFWGPDDRREARAQSELNKIMSMQDLVESNEEPVGYAHGSYEQEEPAGSDLDRMSDLVVCAVHSAQNNHRFDELVINKGLEAATSFCVISDLMASVDGNDDLVEELVTDMAMMMDGSKRSSIIRALYSSLPESDRDRIATNGL